MTDRPARDPLDDFAWHPDPELVWYVDPARSRESVEALGAAAWEVALDWLYDEGFRRPTGPMGYAELRRLWYGMPADAPASSVGPGPAPSDPVPASAVLDEFRARLSEHQLSSVHRLSWSYFTPPPLLLSVVGELLAQVIDQGVDVWRAAPTGAFVEEETVRWLCDLVGYGPDGFGVLTSGGVMANIMAMTVARDIHLGRLIAGGSAATLGRRREASPRSPVPACTRATRRTSRSAGPSTSSASLPTRCGSCRPTGASGSRRARSPRRSQRTAGRAPAVRHRRGRRLDEHRIGG